MLINLVQLILVNSMPDALQKPLPIQAIYTDGSGGFGPYGGRGICGYAAIVWYDKDTMTVLGGTETLSTHQRAELWAIILALNHLRHLKKQFSVSDAIEFPIVPIFSDSKYVIDALNYNWIAKWQQNGWLNTKGCPVADRDLWLQLIGPYPATFHHIMGHSDALGKKGRLAQLKNRDRFGLHSDRHNLGNQLANSAAGQFRRGEKIKDCSILV